MKWDILHNNKYVGTVDTSFTRPIATLEREVEHIGIKFEVAPGFKLELKTHSQMEREHRARAWDAALPEATLPEYRGLLDAVEAFAARDMTDEKTPEGLLFKKVSDAMNDYEKAKGFKPKRTRK